jgi:hypothetical protein
MDQDEKAQLVKFFSSFRTKPSITLKVWITLKHFVLSTDSAPGAGFHLPKPRPYFFCRCNWRRRLPTWPSIWRPIQLSMPTAGFSANKRAGSMERSCNCLTTRYFPWQIAALEENACSPSAAMHSA